MKYSLFNTCRKYLKVVLCAVSLFAGTSFVHAQVTVEATIDSLQLLIGEQAKIKLPGKHGCKSEVVFTFV